jgi:Na+/proline symporter
VQQRYDAAFEGRRAAALRLDEAFHRSAGVDAEVGRFKRADQDFQAARKQALDLVDRVNHTKGFNDTNYIFLSYVTNFLPAGVVGLLIGVIFTAAISSSSGEINSLATVSVIDVYKRFMNRHASDTHYLWASRLLTAFWGIYAVVFANSSRSFGALIEAVNQIGSFFYGSMLGVFALAFFFKRVRGTAAFWGVITGQLAIFLTSLLTHISYLWFNVIGCVIVVIAALLITSMSSPERAGT